MSIVSNAQKLHHRLCFEEHQMLALRTEGFLDIQGIGERPHRQYRVTVHTDSYIKGAPPSPSAGPHIFTITVPGGYPFGRAPAVHFESAPIAHVNVFTNGNVCIGSWGPQETMATETLRTIRLILLDPATFNFSSPADSSCASFCRSRQGCDDYRKVRLPAPLTPAQLADEGPP